MVNVSRVMTFPVASDSIFTDPVRLPVGNRQMQSSVRLASEFDVEGAAAWT